MVPVLTDELRRKIFIRFVKFFNDHNFFLIKATPTADTDKMKEKFCRGNT